MRTFEKIDERTLKLTETDPQDPSKVTTVIYQIPEKITTWQVMQFVKYGSDFFKASSNTGKVIGSAILSMLKGGVTTKQVSEAIGKAGMLLTELSGGDFVQGVVEGYSDILAHIADEDRLAKYYATLYLRDGEKRLNAEQLAERTDLFTEAPVSQLFGGLAHFFKDRIESLRSTLSPSKTSEKSEKTPANTPPTEISSELTPTSIGSSD